MPRKTKLKDFQESIMRRVRRRIRPRLIDRARIRFDAAKQFLLQQIIEHPISKELENLDNPSKFLNGGKGTLYGFFGFPAGTQPVKELINLVNEVITFQVGNRWRTNILPVYIQFLNESDLSELTKLPWAPNIPWPAIVETFTLSPLVGSFLEARTEDLGRSRLGIQADRQIRQASFRNTQYLTPIFERFRKELVKGRIIV